MKKEEERRAFEKYEALCAGSKSSQESVFAERDRVWREKLAEQEKSGGSKGEEKRRKMSGEPEYKEEKRRKRSEDRDYKEDDKRRKLSEDRDFKEEVKSRRRSEDRHRRYSEEQAHSSKEGKKSRSSSRKKEKKESKLKKKEAKSKKREDKSKKKEEAKAKMEADQSEDASDDDATPAEPFLNALQMLQMGLKLNREAEKATEETKADERDESPAVENKSPKSKKSKKDKREKEKEKDLKEKEKLLELYEDEKKLKEMFKKSPSKEKKADKAKDEEAKEDKFKFKLKDSKKRLQSIPPEQEEYLEKIKEDAIEGRVINKEAGELRVVRRLEDSTTAIKVENKAELEDGEVCSSAVASDDDEERAERLEAVADAKVNLELIRTELERVRKKVHGSSKGKKGKKLKKKDKADHEEMVRLEKEVEEMAKEVMDIEKESSLEKEEKEKKKHKKKKKHKEDKDTPEKINIEVDARLGKKILSMFISKDMFQDVLKKEAKNTESAIKSIQKALEKKHQKDEKSKRKKKEKKENNSVEDEEFPSKKRLKSLDSDLAKYESLVTEVLNSPPAKSSSGPHPGSSGSRTRSPSPTLATKRKSRSSSADREGSRKKRRRRSKSPEPILDSSQDTSSDPPVDQLQRTVRIMEEDISDHKDEEENTKKKKKKKKDKKTSQEKEERKKTRKNKSRKNDELIDTDQNVLSVTDSNQVETSQDASEDLDILDLNIGEDDLMKEPVVIEAAESQEVSTTVSLPGEEEVERQEADRAVSRERARQLEAQLQAARLAQARNHRFAANRSKPVVVAPVVVEESSPPPPPPQAPVVTSSTSSYPNLPLPRYAYSYSRTFITPEQKAEHFPNLFQRFFVPMDSESDESDGECPPDCGTNERRIITDLSLVHFLRSLRNQPR